MHKHFWGNMLEPACRSAILGKDGSTVNFVDGGHQDGGLK